MKTVLCYGDSNTWGTNAATRGRFGRDERWPGVLRQALGNGYWVIEEGLGGRTTVWDDPIEGYKNGKEYLIPCLDSHKPLDLVVMMLGTNDLKKRFSLSAYDIAEGAGVLVNIIQRSKAGPNEGAPQVLLMAPPLVTHLSDYAEMLEGAEARSRQLAGHYRRVADFYGCHFLDAGSIVVCTDLDGVHLDMDEHRKLGQAVAGRVQEILG